MSDRRNYSPSERDDARMDDPYGRDWSDDEYSGGPRGREKFRRERSIEGDHGTSASRHDDFDRYDRKKRPRRSITPPEERRRYKRRSSYSRGASPSPYPDGDCYIPNYSRDGYSPAPRYSSLRKGSEPNSSFGGFPDMMSMMGPNWPMGRSASFDLEQLDHVVSFKQFCEHLRRTHPRSHFDEEDLQQRYQRYREKQQAKQLAKFFANNKEKQWFKEKYHPAISRDRIKQTKERRLQYLKSFLMELSEGKYDNVQYDATDGSTEEESTSDLKEEENENDTEKSNGDSSAADAQEFENYLVIKTVSPTIARDRIIEVCAGVEGFEYLALSEPSPTKKFHRIGWIHFKEGTDMQKAFEELDNRKVDDFTLHLAMNRKGQNTAKSFKFAPESANTLHRLRKDLEQARKLARVFESELDGAADGLAAVCERAKRVINEHESENSERDEKDKDEEEKWALKKELDMITAYLRQVHMYCYYCALECDSLEEINRRCVNPHRRAQKTSSGNKNDKHLNQFFKNLDHKVSLKLHRPEGRDLERLGGKLEQRELDKFVQEHVQKEHEAKYKCQVGDCSKAFKGLEYVEKHIFAKHKEETDKIKEETEFFNNYICDPNHLVGSITGGSNAVGMVMPSMGAMPIGMTPFMMPGMRMQGAVPGTPLDQIPRIGFIDNGWPAAAAAGRGGSIYDRLGRPNRNGMDLDEDMPRDPRQVKSYVDLDAPAEGDADISFY